MNTGTVSYQCSCVGINFNYYKIEINEPPLSGFVLKADGYLLEIDVELVDIFDNLIAKRLAYDSVCKLIDHICLMFLVKIGEPLEIQISLPQAYEPEARLTIRNIYQTQVIENIQLQFSPDPRCLDSLKNQVINYWRSDNLNIRLFRNAMSQEDPVTRYLLLYNLLLFINSDKQSLVDDRIISIAPDTETRPSPNNNKPETIYTRLRNEIAHVRQDVEYQETINKITEKLSKFTEIVKQAVLSG